MTSSTGKTLVINNNRECKMFKEISAFKKLKEIITKEFGSDAVDDKRITRFLIARDFDVSKAYMMLTKDLEWRKMQKVDAILQDYHVTELYVKHFPLNIIGFDKEGFLLLLGDFGKVDHKGFSKSATNREILRHFVYIFELCELKMEEQSKVTRKSVDKWTIILNMEGFSFHAVSNKRVIDRGIEISQINEAHYPEKLNMLILINVPRSFQLFASILKPFIPLKTQQKVIFYGKDGWREELLKRVDPDVLPAYLGGRRTDPDGNPMCYSFVCHGGPVSENFYKNSGNRHLKNKEGVKSHVIQRRSKFTLPLEVHVEGSILKWEFEIDTYDVRFGLFYKDSNNEDKLFPLIPVQKLDSGGFCETGTFKCDKTGTYILMLDNSFSFLRSKNIYYKVSVVQPDEKDV